MSKEIYSSFIGKNVMIRTVTMIQIGRLVEVGKNELLIEDACWCASTGRFNHALKTGQLDEVEPFLDGPVIVGRGAFVDLCLWDHELPRSVK